MTKRYVDMLVEQDNMPEPASLWWDKLDFKDGRGHTYPRQGNLNPVGLRNRVRMLCEAEEADEEPYVDLEHEKWANYYRDNPVD